MIIQETNEVDLWQELMQDIFFLQYHMHVDYFTAIKMPISVRKYMIVKAKKYCLKQG